MIDEQNYEQWAMDYIEGTLDATRRQEFNAFLASHPAIAAQITSLCDAMPVLPPSEVTFPDKKQLLRGREIRLARRQDRLQRFGAMMSGAAAAAVLFGGMFLFNPNRPGKGTDQMAAEATAAYPEGAEALAERMTETTEQEAEVKATLTEPAIQDELATQTPIFNASSLNRATQNQANKISQPAVELSVMHPDQNSTIQPAENYIQQSEQRQILNSLSTPVQLYAAAPQVNLEQVAIQPSQRTETRSIVAQRIAANRKAASTHDRDNSESNDIRSSVETLLSTINDVSPISHYRTSEEEGITIASFIHIGREIDSN